MLSFSVSTAHAVGSIRRKNLGVEVRKLFMEEMIPELRP